MATDSNVPDTIKSTAIDYVASGAKSVLGAVPFVGSLLVELANTIIPNQRVDRIARFAALLGERISHLEEGTVRAELKNEEFTDLLEESLRQASRSISDERRAYLASLVANSLTSEAIEHAESTHLLRILGELNDVEVVWLRSFQDPTIGGDQEFREQHAEVLEPARAYLGCSTEELDKHALQQSYRKHLIDLGLVTAEISKDRDGKPEFDRFTGDFKISYYHTSPLGELLLRTIGLSMRDAEQQRGADAQEDARGSR